MGEDRGEVKERERTLLVHTPGPVAVDRHNWPAGSATGAGPGEDRAAVPVEGEVPHQAAVGVVLDGPDEAVSVSHVKNQAPRVEIRLDLRCMQCRCGLTGYPCTTVTRNRRG